MLTENEHRKAVIGRVIRPTVSGTPHKRVAVDLQTHRAVFAWLTVQHIFNSRAIIFLPVLPTLCPPVA